MKLTQILVVVELVVLGWLAAWSFVWQRRRFWLTCSWIGSGEGLGVVLCSSKPTYASCDSGHIGSSCADRHRRP